ncbi:MAG: hypothetical protein LC122_14015 [Chitinophagales bacterium]|nr:hypothetical protein [Chitinophagales bacterium]
MVDRNKLLTKIMMLGKLVYEEKVNEEDLEKLSRLIEELENKAEGK